MEFIKIIITVLIIAAALDLLLFSVLEWWGDE